MVSAVLTEVVSERDRPAIVCDNLGALGAPRLPLD